MFKSSEDLLTRPITIEQKIHSTGGSGPTEQVGIKIVHHHAAPPPEPIPSTWNLPSLTSFREDYFVRRTTVSQKITQAFSPTTASESKESSKVVLIAAHGLGGIGKTYLAAEYIFNTAKKYAYRIWFNSESPEQLAREYRRFCMAFHIFLDEKSTDEIVIEKVKIWFSSHPSWLLVYDNAPDDKTLAPFLPKPKREGGGDILVTSRYAHRWPGQTIAVDVLEEKEAIELVKRRIRNGDAEAELKETEETALQQLVKELGYLPLALAQAAAYIAECDITIAQYLKEYRSVTASKLEENFLGHQCDEIVILSDESALPEDAADYKPHTIYLIKADSDPTAKIIAHWSYDREHIKQGEFSSTELKLLTFPKTKEASIKIRVTEQVILAEKILSLINYNRESEYPKSVATTWLITMERIRRQSPKALTMLQGCAYLAPNQIPREVLLVFLATLQAEDHKENSTSESLDKVQEFDVYRMVQEITRSHLQIRGEQKNTHLNPSLTSRKAVENLVERLWVSDKEIKEGETKNENVEGILRYLSNYSMIESKQEQETISMHRLVQQVIRSQKQKPTEYRQVLVRLMLKSLTLSILPSEVGIYQDRRLWIIHFSKILAYYKVNKWPLTFDYARAAEELGTIYVEDWSDGRRGKYYLKQTKAIYESYCGRKFSGLGKTLTTLGVAYGLIGQRRKERDFLQCALAVKEEHYGEKDINLVTTLVSLGITYGSFGNQKKSWISCTGH